MTSHHCPTCFGITRLDSENVRWCQCPTTRDKDAEIARLRAAAQAVVDRWDSPLWKQAEPTAVFIGALRKELERQ